MSFEDITSRNLSNPILNKDQMGKMKGDNLNTEFQYYGVALRNLVPALTKITDRERIIPWVNKLFAPQYHVEIFRDNRNRYLASMVINIINDELTGVFKKDPPAGPLKNLRKMKVINARAAEWEKDKTWFEYIEYLADEYKELPCTFHSAPEACARIDSDYDEQLDFEFKFLLYQIRPYAALMPNSDSRTKVSAWLQSLCRISSDKCLKMKSLRNEYAYALYGYVHDLRIAGPFQDYPPLNSLPTLAEAAEQAAKRHPLTSPHCEEAESFMCDQPTPEEGAFCYIAVTGELAQSDDLLPEDI